MSIGDSKYFNNVSINEGTLKDADQIPEKGIRVARLLQAAEISDRELSTYISEWERISGEMGYQHNYVRLGNHLKDAVRKLQSLSEFKQLHKRDQHLTLIATLFHDIAKPTGRKDEYIPRDFSHDEPSAEIAGKYMKEWGYPEEDMKKVKQLILCDGIVSDIARNKVRDPAKNFTPAQLKALLGPDISIPRMLKVLNQADVIATVGEDGFERISIAYNNFFDEMEKFS